MWVSFPYKRMVKHWLWAIAQDLLKPFLVRKRVNCWVLMVGHEVTEHIQGFAIAKYLESYTDESLAQVIFPHPLYLRRCMSRSCLRCNVQISYLKGRNMPRGLNNKVALIRGAAQGIGRGIALRLAQEGVHIGLVDLHQEKLNTVQQRG